MALTTKKSKLTPLREPSKETGYQTSFNSAPHTVVLKEVTKEGLLKRIKIKEEVGWVQASDITFKVGDKTHQITNENYRNLTSRRNRKRGVELESSYQVAMCRGVKN